MTKLAIELDDSLDQLLLKAAECAGKSPSEWVRDVVEERLSHRLPESWFALLGTWEDRRTPDEILADIRTYPPQMERPPLT